MTAESDEIGTMKRSKTLLTLLTRARFYLLIYS